MIFKKAQTMQVVRNVNMPEIFLYKKKIIQQSVRKSKGARRSDLDKAK